jgi:peptidoglycan/xylan/chitin deacetylase (PgdA/CDA1 family)
LRLGAQNGRTNVEVFGGRQMRPEKASPGVMRASVSRRVLLTVGGLTVFSVWAADPLHRDPAAPRLPDAQRAPAGRADTLTAGDRSARHLRASRPHPARTAPHEPQLAAARHGGPGAGEPPLRAIDGGSKAIALTIDDGPNPIYTPQVLALLARYRVTATFSMIGIQAQAHPAVAREVAAAGHLIVNHTWTHLNLAWLPPAMVTEQMSRGTDAIHAATGRIPDLFRAPYGAWSPFVLSQCARTGMVPLGWSVDPRDWSRPGVAAIVNNIMRNTRTGSIILEHDGGGNRSQTVEALKIVIPRLLAAGYHFRTP